jgi:hypothetical protein
MGEAKQRHARRAAGHAKKTAIRGPGEEERASIPPAVTRHPARRSLRDSKPAIRIHSLPLLHPHGRPRGSGASGSRRLESRDLTSHDWRSRDLSHVTATKAAPSASRVVSHVIRAQWSRDHGIVSECRARPESGQALVIPRSRDHPGHVVLVKYPGSCDQDCLSRKVT